LKEAGAKVVERLFSDAESRLDVVIASKDADDAIIERSQQLKIPLVSSEWIIQSLYARKPCKFNENPKFQWDYDEDEAKVSSKGKNKK
jgi:hypothetical protein